MEQLELNTNKRPDRLPTILPQEPMNLADTWIKEAEDLGVQRNTNAMTIASVNDQGCPSARIVLCKAFVPVPGYLVFYTNYQSRKAKELSENGNAAALFHWDGLGRQIRIEGKVLRSPTDESDAYFATRDWGSQLGAWGSDQSSPIQSREALVQQINERGKRLGISIETDTKELNTVNAPAIERPPHWGGFRLWARSVELWVEGGDRIHDRARWVRNLDAASEHDFVVSEWSSTRLQP